MRRLIPILLISLLIFGSCSRNHSSLSNSVEPELVIKKFSALDKELVINLTKGKHHNHPSFAIWLEDLEGQVIQTLFVTKSVATGIFQYGDAGDGTWLRVSGPASRPASLPYWLHRREVAKTPEFSMPNPDNKVPDAYTGATPSADFRLKVIPASDLPDKFRLLVEVNQPWDWNDTWSNEKYPDVANYHTSAQPSVVYAVEVHLDDLMETYHLNPIGHGHFAGADGKLYTDLSGMTTALDIFKSITLQVQKQ